MTRSFVPTTVPIIVKSSSGARRRGASPLGPLRRSCRLSITRFGMTSSATALFTSTARARSGVPRVGNPKPIAPLTKAASNTAAIEARTIARATRAGLRPDAWRGGPRDAGSADGRRYPARLLRRRPSVLGTDQVDGLVAQGQETRRLEADDRDAATRVRREPLHVPCGVVARLGEHALGDERPTAALPVDEHHTIARRLEHADRSPGDLRHVVGRERVVEEHDLAPRRPAARPSAACGARTSR